MTEENLTLTLINIPIMQSFTRFIQNIYYS